MRNKKLSLLGSSLISVAAATALTVLATQGALAQKKYDTGATDTEIKIGNVEAYSGPPPPTASSARPRTLTSR